MTSWSTGQALCVAALGAVLLAGLPGPAGAACDASGTDAAAVAEARAALADACDCAATTRAEWTRCVRRTVASAQLSAACERHVRRAELRSACGRPEAVVCCETEQGGATRARLAPDGTCDAPPGGSVCQSVWRHVADACTADGCAPAASCGNGLVERGETCDPPQGFACDASCRRPPPGCVDDASTLLVDCTLATGTVAAAANGGTFLVAYEKPRDAGWSPVVARRFAADGTLLDARPIVVSDRVRGGARRSGARPAATALDEGFYVAWEAFASLGGLPIHHFRGRAVPVSGQAGTPVALLGQYLGFGSCRVQGLGPADVAARVDDAGVHATWRDQFVCFPTVLAENIAGLPGVQWAPPLPGYVSSGPAPLARGASDAVAVWWGGFIDDPPVIPDASPLLATWMDDGEIDALPISVPVGVAAAGFAWDVAATGEVFLVAWVLPAPEDATHDDAREVRALRFTRGGGALDPTGGVLLATSDATIPRLVAGADGDAFTVAWLEDAGGGEGTIRALRVAADGEVLDAQPLDVATTDDSAALAVAGDPAATYVVLTRREVERTAVRAVALPPPGGS